MGLHSVRVGRVCLLGRCHEQQLVNLAPIGGNLAELV